MRRLRRDHLCAILKLWKISLRPLEKVNAGVPRAGAFDHLRLSLRIRLTGTLARRLVQVASALEAEISNGDHHGGPDMLQDRRAKLTPHMSDIRLEL